MDDLLTWLRGVLDEDAALAKAALWSSDPERWRTFRFEHAEDTWVIEDSYDEGVAQVRAHAADSEAVARFITWNDPVSALADIAAKRAVLDLHAFTVETHKRPPFNEMTGEPQGPEIDVYCDVCRWISERTGTACQTVRLLASAYADRPGYRKEWRPDSAAA